MNRRRSIEIWPAFADLMTVLAVVALSLTVSVNASRDDLISQNLNLAEELAALEGQVHEAARNQEMFGAIQEAQKVVDDLAAKSQLKFDTDQSLQFGDELISFATDSCEPLWQRDGRTVLRRFCEELGAIAQESTFDWRRKFIVHVEGHTDSDPCPGDPYCNWKLSSCRAASFIAIMKEERYCPGGSSWTLLPVGYAASIPISTSRERNRRIAVRLMPNYRVLMNR